MILKKIIIYYYNILYKILDEIKETLNFDLIEVKKENFHKIFEIPENEFLLISKKNIKNLKNQLVLDNLPLRATKLIELINLKFLKERFNSQSHYEIKPYILNLNSRDMIYKNLSISLTEREMNLILFLDNASKPVKISELEKQVWEHGSELETHTVETHIYRLRKKIKEKFKDNNFIISSKKGYLIN